MIINNPKYPKQENTIITTNKSSVSKKTPEQEYTALTTNQRQSTQTMPEQENSALTTIIRSVFPEQPRTGYQFIYNQQEVNKPRTVQKRRTLQ